MYQENKQKEYHRNVRRTNKSMILLASLLLLTFVAVGGTVAFLFDATEQIRNEFVPSTVTTEVVETRSGQTISNVKIKNTGDTEAYIRAAVVVTWQDANGNVYGKTPVKGTDYTITFNTSSQTNPTGKWTLAKDGFYYWSNPVSEPKVGGTTTTYYTTGTLITSCSPVEGKNPEGYFLNVEIIGSGIQSNPTSVVTTEWSSGVKKDIVIVDGVATLDIKE